MAWKAKFLSLAASLFSTSSLILKSAVSELSFAESFNAVILMQVPQVPSLGLKSDWSNCHHFCRLPPWGQNQDLSADNETQVSWLCSSPFSLSHCGRKVMCTCTYCSGVPRIISRMPSSHGGRRLYHFSICWWYAGWSYMFSDSMKTDSDCSKPIDLLWTLGVSLQSSGAAWRWVLKPGWSLLRDF